MRKEQSAKIPTQWPACVGADEAAEILGWPPYFIPLLMRAGHLKPLGRPAQNARKWFATVELERLSQDPAWLDKAVRIVEKHIHETNKKHRTKDATPLPAVESLTQQAA